jgi:hypothetical protein
MAITFFSRQVGQIAAFTDPTIPARTLIRLEDWDGYLVQKSVITSAMLSAQTNLQFLHTMGGNIYVYVFGDRVGTFSLNGLAFDSTCDNSAGLIGVEHVMQYYNQNRASNRAMPLKITLGVASTFVTYLVGMTCQIADPKSRIWEFSYKLALIPFPKKRKSLADSPAAGSGTTTPATGTPAPGSGMIGDFPTPDPSMGLVSVDSGGAITSTDVTVAVPAGSGYSAYGTGPNTTLTRTVAP